MQFGSEQSTANTARCGVCICNAKTCSVWRGNAALCVQCGSALRGGGMCRGSRAEEILSLPLLKSSACMQPEIEMKGWSWNCTGALAGCCTWECATGDFTVLSLGTYRM